jgi:dTDP-glucose pyrophosphorylase/predicted transcriptional regulator
MKKFAHFTLSCSASIRNAVEVIDSGRQQFALIINDNGKLAGTVTDGDIRRGLLRGVTLADSVKTVMNKEFISVDEVEGRTAAIKLIRQHKLRQIPILNAEGGLIDLIFSDERVNYPSVDTEVVLMAGGLGTRLRPLTENIPKPMLQVGGKPVLQIILESLTRLGFYNFTIAINYRGEKIEDYFGDGTNFHANVKYLHEKKRMGTAGALSLLPKYPEKPFIVMNGDLLTSAPFDNLLDFHLETKAVGTICAREHIIEVPYGVLDFNGHALTGISEKPKLKNFINAGIYVLSPEVLKFVYPNRWLDMPTLFERLIENGKKASVFPLKEDWIDIGHIQDLQQARDNFDGDH